MGYYSKTAKLKEIFLGDLAGERFGKSETIPAALHLSKIYAVSRNTIRKMLFELENEGILHRNGNNELLFTNGSVSNLHNSLTSSTAATEKRTVLGWFYSGSRDQLIVERTRGIERFVEENNLELRVVTSLQGHTPLLRQLENIENCGIDGVLVANHPLPSYVAALERLDSIHYPLVIACGHPQGEKFNVVMEDDFFGTYAATSYLLSNHDCPVYFLGNTGNIDARLDAFRRAIYDFGISTKSINDHIRILSQEMDAPANWDMIRKMLVPSKFIRQFVSSLPSPAGIVCANDYIAFGVYEAAVELGLKIGRDLLVTGFGNLPFACRLKPSLTTVQVDYEKLGYQAAWLLYGLICHRIKGPACLQISAKLLNRDSC